MCGVVRDAERLAGQDRRLGCCSDVIGEYSIDFMHTVYIGLEQTEYIYKY